MQEANKIVFRVALIESSPLLLTLTPENYQEEFLNFIKHNKLQRS